MPLASTSSTRIFRLQVESQLPLGGSRDLLCCALAHGRLDSHQTG